MSDTPDITRTIEEILIKEIVDRLGIEIDNYEQDCIEQAVHKLVTLVQEARQVVINEVLDEVAKLEITTQEADDRQLWGFNYALDQVKQQLEGLK